jgi:hypothetical protein
MQQLVSRTGGDSRTFNKPRFVSEAVLLFLLTALWLGWTLIQPQAAFAHAAVEARHASTIPGWFVLLGAAVALILSFVLLNRYQPASGLDTLPFLGWFLQSPAVRRIARILSVALFLLVLAAGFFGHENSDYNAATKLVWVLFWFGLSLFSFLVGNPWDVINPWRTIFRLVSKAAKRKLTLGLRYPPVLGAWPALLLFVAFIWFELSWFQSDEPRSIAWLTLLYSAYLWLGIVLFGMTWLEQADPFTRYFRVLGCFAPIGPGQQGAIEVRPYATALQGRRMETNVEVAFVIAIMYSVTYDGFMATQEWVALMGQMMNQAMRAFPDIPVMEGVQLAVQLYGLVIFVAAYWATCAWMSGLTEGKKTSELAKAFGLTLLPIAIGYFMAHFFLVIGPRFADLGRAFLDPFGWSAPLTPPSVPHPSENPSTVWTPGVVWAIQMILIILGHVISVITAHQVARRVLSGVRRFVLSQIPLLTLMILYTWVSLWITSRPLLFKPLVPLMEELTPAPY